LQGIIKHGVNGEETLYFQMKRNSSLTALLAFNINDMFLEATVNGTGSKSVMENQLWCGLDLDMAVKQI
jgi:hypothetical protein